MIPSTSQNLQADEPQPGTVDLSLSVTDSGGQDWPKAREELTSAIRDMVGQMRQLQQENLVLRSELRQTRLRESGLREERAVLLRDLNYSLETVEKALDLMAVRR